MGLISNGTTVFDAGSMASGFGGSMTHIKTITISSPTDNVQFVHGSSGVVLDSTYKEYIFYLFDMHHNSSSEPDILFNFSIDGGSNYNVAKTSTSYRAYHGENDSGGAHGYYAPTDGAQKTGPLPLSFNADGDNDSSMVAYLHLFNPSSTTFVKHFIGHAEEVHDLPRTNSNYFAGYCNTTSAINAVLFDGQHAEGENNNIDSGKIILFGIN
tara:strand:- start:217 stop:852 length:636 start_codon:yes stop_codon:yes gene_type:complete